MSTAAIERKQKETRALSGSQREPGEGLDSSGRGDGSEIRVWTDGGPQQPLALGTAWSPPRDAGREEGPRGRDAYPEGGWVGTSGPQPAEDKTPFLPVLGGKKGLSPCPPEPACCP